MGQATEEGCGVRMKDDHLILFDRNGSLIVKTKRSKNRLYKVIIEVESIKCLQLIGSNETSKWHARLGQVNIDTMKMMAKKRAGDWFISDDNGEINLCFLSTRKINTTEIL